jgi:hypothetical protein
MSIDDLLNEIDPEGSNRYSTAPSQNNSYGSTYSTGSFTRDRDRDNKSKGSSLFGASGSRGGSYDDLHGEGQRSSFGSGSNNGGSNKSISGGRCLRLVLSGDPNYSRGAKTSIFSKT